MIRAFESIDRDHQGYDTFAGAAHGRPSRCRAIPGARRSCSSRRACPSRRCSRRGSNRSSRRPTARNVTTYAVDAHGLRAKSSSANCRRRVRGFAEERIRPAPDRRRHDGPAADDGVGAGRGHAASSTRVPGWPASPRTPAAFSSRVRTICRRAFRRIDEDSQFHYLLTYSPTNTRVRRQVPGDPGEGPPAGRAGVRAQGLSRDPAPRRGGRAALRGAGARAARSRAAAECVSDPRRGLQLSRSRSPRAHAGARSGGTSRAALRCRRERRPTPPSGDRRAHARRAGREVQRVSQQYLLTGDAKDVDAAKTRRDSVLSRADLRPASTRSSRSCSTRIAAAGSARLATLTVPPRRPPRSA